MKNKFLFYVVVSAIAAAVLYYGLQTDMKSADDTGEEHMPIEFLFEDNGCLKQDIVEGYAEDMHCLDANKDGCVTRAEWDAVMDYWTTNTPEPGQSICPPVAK
jgi:hypothetical protein